VELAGVPVELAGVPVELAGMSLGLTGKPVGLTSKPKGITMITANEAAIAVQHGFVRAKLEWGFYGAVGL
jgi:hypothetical protein